MAHNPMVEIVLEHALNALTEVQDILSKEITTTQFIILEIEKSPNKIEAELVAYKERLDQYTKVKQTVDKVLRQGNSLDI
jgi:hypothetical protein